MPKMKFPSTTQHLEERLMNRIRFATSEKLNESRFYNIDLVRANWNDGFYRKVALKALGWGASNYNGALFCDYRTQRQREC